ncbi:MAG TPA: serine/threonine-protein kinase [Pirellulaceae bacterium]|nr:serine/threonine-protein kinase [Pirellulaceae bacterium]
MNELSPLESIFFAALEKAPADRASYLAEACSGDDSLRRRVEKMLLAHADANSFLEVPPAANASPGDPTIDQSVAERPGTQIGPYKLLQQIGEGGFGVVYMAEQTEPVRRKVALKLIKPGMDSRQVIARFEAERQALAVMDHPNIAKVLDAGTVGQVFTSHSLEMQVDNLLHAGRPYFVMELVRGIPITQYCDENSLPIRERLELFATVCQAIQHAHTKGIIHRDVKPTNVLVTRQDGQPIVKVIDFGIAKAMGQQLTEKTLFTDFAQMIGTPLYMSPEQAELSSNDIDTRSDIYSLGVLLYELLTGSTPVSKEQLKQAAFDEIRRIIREEEPQKPSTRISGSGTLASIAAQRHVEPARLSRLVRGELDWIVMKTLEKDRNRRYETANGLALDVQRYLADEAVLACPPSAGYRLRKFARRNKSPIAAAVLVALALLGGAAAATWQAVRAIKAEALAGLRYEAEREAREQADAARKDAVAERKAAEVEAAKATAVSDLLQEMLASANPDRGKGAEYTVRQLLDDSTHRVRDQLEEQPEVEAAVRAAIGNAYRRLGLTDKAEPHLARALAIRRAEAATPEEILAQSLLDYGRNLYESGHRPDAERHAREALAIDGRRGVRTAKTLEALAALHLFLNGQFRYDDAETVANEAISLGREIFPQGHPELANVLHRLADGKLGQGQHAAAEALAREALLMHERWHGKEHPETAWGLRVLGTVETAQGRHAEAAASYRRASAIFEKLFGESHHWSSGTRELLQRTVEASGDPAAIAALRAEQAGRLAGALKRAASEAADEADVALHRGEIFLGVGLWDEAWAEFDSAARLPEPSVGQAERFVSSYARLADARGKSGQSVADEVRARAEQVRWSQRLVALDPSPGRRNDLAGAHAFHGIALEKGRHHHEAEEAYGNALALWKQLSDEDPAIEWYRQERAHFSLGLGVFLRAAGRLEEALEHCRTSVRLNEQLLADFGDKPHHQSRLAHGRGVLISVLSSVGDDEEVGKEIEALLKGSPSGEELNSIAWPLISRSNPSAGAARQAVELAQKAVELNPSAGHIWNTLGVAHYRAGSWLAAIEALQKSRELNKDKHFSADAFFLAMAHWQLANKDEAGKWYEQAVEWMDKHQPKNEELRRFRAEAAKLLELEKKRIDHRDAKGTAMNVYWLDSAFSKTRKKQRVGTLIFANQHSSIEPLI